MTQLYRDVFATARPRAAPGLIPGAFRIGAAGYLQVRSRFLHEPDAHSLSLAQSEPLPFLFWQRPAFKPQPQYWLPPQSESELQPQTWAKSRQRFVEHSPFTRHPWPTVLDPGV